LGRPTIGDDEGAFAGVGWLLFLIPLKNDDKAKQFK
jgi:hypothetical protein